MPSRLLCYGFRHHRFGDTSSAAALTNFAASPRAVTPTAGSRFNNRRFFGQSRRFHPLFFLRAGRLREVRFFAFDHRLGHFDDVFGNASPGLLARSAQQGLNRRYLSATACCSSTFAQSRFRARSFWPQSPARKEATFFLWRYLRPHLAVYSWRLHRS